MKILSSYLLSLSVSAHLPPLLLLWTSSFHIQITSALALPEKGERLCLSYNSQREGLQLVLFESHAHSLNQTQLTTGKDTVIGQAWVM